MYVVIQHMLLKIFSNCRGVQGDSVQGGRDREHQPRTSTASSHALRRAGAGLGTVLNYMSV